MDDSKQGGEELHPDTHKPKSDFAQREEAVLAFWSEQSIFQKSLEKPAPKGDFVFYDGPPFANGLPHYGHILASSIKDAIPRYRTMRGFRVERRWGWDCHGLPVENLVEKELGFKTKRDIEAYGVGKFNEAARRSIMKDVSDWKRIIPRMGRWADMEQDYKTMDTSYTESVWWAFKRLFDHGLIYEGFKGMQLCPRCGTTLSNFEVAQGYQDIDDVAVTVKLPLVDEPDTSLLIWTTTPWTLPGNTAAAVNADATYVKAMTSQGRVIVAKDLAAKVLPEGYVVEAEIEGKALVGKYYEPPFEYFKDTLHKHKTHAWRVYAAPYVTLTDGTGIVHLAPAYGAEDLALAQQEKIPLIQHVTEEGLFIKTVTDFAHLPVKPKGRHKETDLKIAEALKASGRLFAQEIIKHSYPHCWRCDTPLLNWAADSWFVNVQKVKPAMLAQNAKMSWVPEHVGKGRFQKGIESAPDWAISRSRYWGAPIPVWKHSKTKELRVAGSVDELLSMVKRSGNTYFVMRHGEAQSNVSNTLESVGDPKNCLTQKGKGQVVESAKLLNKKGAVDLIISSPLPRTVETAKLLQKEYGLPEAAVMVDERLREIALGEFEGKIEDWVNFVSTKNPFTENPKGGENYTEVRRRIGELLFEIESRYSGKTIVFVTHGNPARQMLDIAKRKSITQLLRAEGREKILGNGEFAELPFVPFPHNADFELDLHRPYIDEVPMGTSMDGSWERVPQVFDCWFESGSMPFASKHYPFDKTRFDPKRALGFWPKGYPADFIAEGLDQTRGWFYSLIVLGTALFGKSPYQNVIVNGLILGADGQKLSKRLKNYADPIEVASTVGADSIRYYLLSSPLVRGEDLVFSLRGVEEVAKKLLMRLDNVRSFYDLYADASTKVSSAGHADFPAEKSAEVLAPSRSKLPAKNLSSTHILDRWILSRLNELVRDTTAGFEKYELDIAARPLGSFIDDLSTWYLRRSRDRFKTEGADKEQALATLRHVLYTVAHIMAPMMPFFADDLYQRVRTEGDPESVHLSVWPEAGAVDEVLHTAMTKTRVVCSRALELREKAGRKVRQPLATLKVKTLVPDEALYEIIADEVNVKTVTHAPELENEVWLDTELTPELKDEGKLRDFVRTVQDLRKTENYSIADRPALHVATNAEGLKFLERWHATLLADTGLRELVGELEETAAPVGDFVLIATLKR